MLPFGFVERGSRRYSDDSEARLDDPQWPHIERLRQGRAALLLRAVGAAKRLPVQLAELGNGLHEAVVAQDIQNVSQAHGWVLQRRSLLLNGIRDRRRPEVEEVEDESVWMNGLDPMN